MLKGYIRTVLISLGCGAAIFFLASFTNEAVFNVNFFRMLETMLFIIGTTGFFIYSFSKNKILNIIFQTVVMIASGIIVPMMFGIAEFNWAWIITTALGIGISYPIALLIVYKIQKSNLKKINEKLLKNQE